MASSTSRDLDLERNPSLATDFLGIGRDDLASDFAKADRVSRSGRVVETDSDSGAALSTEILLGAAAPARDYETEEPPLPRVVKRTADDVWKEILAGKRSPKKPKEELMTLEDFLVKAGAVEEDEAARGIVEVKREGLDLDRGFYSFEDKCSVVGSGGSGVSYGSLDRGKRSVSLLEPLDKASQQRQRRMIKNRESAARSRERKQAYQVELETMAERLEEENEQLLREKAEHRKKRLKQLMENVIPVVEKQRPPRLQRVRSM